MRNGVEVNGLIVTIDNSGCIGNKELDAVQVPNEITAYFTTRTAILEQWCAGAMPIQLLMANFSGDHVWMEYEQGIRRVFGEIGIPCPPIIGSSETNFNALQSAVSLTMIGEKIISRTINNCHYFVIGQPLVGNEVIENPQQIAQLNELYQGLTEGWIQAIWPTGSKGIGAEITRFIGGNYFCELDLHTSAGPSCAVLVAVLEQHVEQFSQQISAPITEIIKE
ncbi:MAG: hypothetical protein ABS944_01930 [Solibacillus sp.]|uniref:hypothetical protein n=1 Tax=unclassified Solibacillus TaxID=2637870 RepID=UPI0030FBAE50